MNNHHTTGTRIAGLALAALAISTTTMGPADAQRMPESSSLLAPAPAGVPVSRLVATNHAASVRAALADLRAETSSKSAGGGPVITAVISGRKAASVRGALADLRR